MSIKFSRVWSMPNKDTLSIKPIKELVERYIKEGDVVVDSFARNCKLGTITNDLDPETQAEYHMDAIEFCEMLVQDNVVADVVILDPPYSPRQMSECYKKVGLKKGMEGTQNARLYKECKDRLTKILKPDGIAVCCGWNSNGFGITRKFELMEILLVPTGAAHNDFIVTVEKKKGGVSDESTDYAEVKVEDIFEL